MPDPLPDNYPSLDRKTKLGLLWQRVCADEYGDVLPSEPPSGFDRRLLFTPGHNRVAVEHVSDEMPEGRVKLLHRYGAVAQVELVILNDLGYTGVFASGGHGLLRYSDAAGGETPEHSFVLKLLVDGRPSLNLHVLRAEPIHGEVADIHDPFQLSYSSIAAKAETAATKALEVAFDGTAKILHASRLGATELPLNHLAEVTDNGCAVSEPRAAFRVDFHATSEARSAYQSRGDSRLSLGTFQPGMRLFSIHASDTGEGGERPWAELVLRSRFVASAYGDERLFFQHNLGPTHESPLKRLKNKLTGD